jgi:hypothetical protein
MHIGYLVVFKHRFQQHCDLRVAVNIVVNVQYICTFIVPAVTPKYCTKEIEKCSLEHVKKQRKKKHLLSTCPQGCSYA